jgi:nitrate/TMAO reductase-like tetraheme cytochrome c subunit
MMKQFFVYLCAALIIGAAGYSLAVDLGPEDMILQAEKDKAKKPKPSVFPHKAHQEFAECGDCHHGVDADGNVVAYTEGMEVQKCETCHYKGSGMPKKIETYKGAAHENCRGCHKQVAAENAELAAKWTKCMPCHPKDM